MVIKKGREFLKAMAVSALSIGFFSAAFVGINNVAFAASTTGVGIAPPVTSSVVGINFQNQQRQFSVEIPSGMHAPQGADVLSAEEAAKIGADALQQIFEADLNGVTIQMHFVEGIDPENPPARLPDSPEIIAQVEVFSGWSDEIGMTLDEMLDYIFENVNTYFNEDVTRENIFEKLASRLGVSVEDFINTFSNTWNVTRLTSEWAETPNAWFGSITPEGALFSQFSFEVNADTGELRMTSYFPWALDTVGMEWPDRFINVNEVDVFEPTQQHNYDFARLAMDIAMELEIFEGEVEQARLLGWGMGFSPVNDEPINFMMVEVKASGDEAVVLTFEGAVASEAVLTTVDMRGIVARVIGQDAFEWVGH